MIFDWLWAQMTGFIGIRGIFNRLWAEIKVINEFERTWDNIEQVLDSNNRKTPASDEFRLFWGVMVINKGLQTITGYEPSIEPQSPSPHISPSSF
jgi:hypothetical protein